MIRPAAAILVVVCLGVGAGLTPGPAAAEPDDGSAPTTTVPATPDQRFTDAMTALQIPLKEGTDVPAVGHGVCDMLTAAIKNNVNPIPSVRGVVTELQNRGLTRAQAIGLMRISSGVYCPEYGRYVR
ncbi:MAG: DUF732 domain-containing protein [Mycobacterium sp.]